MNMVNRVKSGRVVKVKKLIPSEVKWTCPMVGCSTTTKFRVLRDHLLKVHSWKGTSFSCRIEGCGWSCGKDMHCLTNHSKTCHSLIDDVPYDLAEPTGVGLDQQGMHSQSCLLDLNWHVGCIGKLARSKKVKALKVCS